MKRQGTDFLPGAEFMNIRIAQEKDFTDIANLHINSIKTGFLSELGVSFLTKLYKSINNQKGSIVLVSETHESICGFIAGSVNTSHLYKKVLIKDFFIFILPLSKFIFSPNMLLKMYETVAYGLNKQSNYRQNSPSAELLSIAVSDSKRGKGIGKELLAALEEYFNKCGVKQYKVVTFSEDKCSNSFYISSEFILTHQFIHHRNLMNLYKKTLNN